MSLGLATADSIGRPRINRGAMQPGLTCPHNLVYINGVEYGRQVFKDGRDTDPRKLDVYSEWFPSLLGKRHKDGATESVFIDEDSVFQSGAWDIFGMSPVWHLETPNNLGDNPMLWLSIPGLRYRLPKSVPLVTRNNLYNAMVYLWGCLQGGYLGEKLVLIQHCAVHWKDKEAQAKLSIDARHLVGRLHAISFGGRFSYNEAWKALNEIARKNYDQHRWEL